MPQEIIGEVRKRLPEELTAVVDQFYRRCRPPTAARGGSFDKGFLGLPDGSRLVLERIEGDTADAQKLGRALGERILARGGREVLALLAQPRQ